MFKKAKKEQASVFNYQIIKKIGSGGFSEVYKVEDENKKEFALKKIEKSELDSLSYIYSEIEIMKKFSFTGSSTSLSTNNSEIFQEDYIVQLVNWYEDEDYFYLIMEYCDGGDIRNQMERHTPIPVIPFKDATYIIAEIIKGLQLVHSKGLIHRDIKVQNILVKNIRETSSGKIINKKYIIGDFGVSKSIVNKTAHTVLGTRQYMSPEIFKEGEYGFEIDMWALGVLFCFMLNRSYPFKINPFLDGPKEMWEWIRKQSKNFSYKKYVEDTKYRQVGNCTPEMEDLFNKIFQANPSKRMTFIEIRKHPVFKEYFCVDKKEEERLKAVYKRKIEESQVSMRLNGMENIDIRRSREMISGVCFQNEENLILLENNKIQFLFRNFEELEQVDNIDPALKISALYNILKYYLIRKNKFIFELKNGSICDKFANPRDMAKFVNSAAMKYCIFKFEDEFNKNQFKFQELEEVSRQELKRINKLNPEFKDNIGQAYDIDSIHTIAFEGTFKTSYRRSTQQLYNHFKKNYDKVAQKLKHKYCYYLVIVLISHFANRMFIDSTVTSKIFSKFTEEHKMITGYQDLEKLRRWMKKTKHTVLGEISYRILEQWK